MGWRFLTLALGTLGCMMRKRAAFAAAALVLMVFAGGGSTAPGVRAAVPAIAWEPCGRIECGTLEVPLDYAEPGGRMIELSLVRVAAREPSERIGVLLANPGGPGGSGNDFVRVWANALSNDIRNRFDIIGFDPRGVGESTPVVCHDHLQELVAADPDPDTEAEWDAAKRVAERLAKDCAARHGDLLPHVGTRNVARDMDRIRESLGEEQITYVGYSYGTTIGSVYADMFPSRVRAMVLDGGTDLSLSVNDGIRTQIMGFERALEAYLADCREDRCAIAKDGDPRKVVEEVLAKAEASPIPAPRADRPAGPGEAELGIISALYSKFTWGALTAALEQARKGDGSGLVELTDAYLQREPDGSYPNLIEANIAVNSVDGECSKDPEAGKALGELVAKDAPTFGRSAATSGLVCAYWPAKADPLTTPRAAGTPPIVVIATTNDPATPYEWGKALSEQLESGVLVTYRGEGHTIYAQGSGCIDDLVDAYLVGLAVPAEGSVCGRGAPPPVSADQEDSAGTLWYWVVGLALFALAVVFLALAFVKHRRQAEARERAIS